MYDFFETLKRNFINEELIYIPNADEFLLENPIKSRNLFHQITKFETSNAAIIFNIKNNQIFILTDGRYIESAKKHFFLKENIEILLLTKENIVSILNGKKILIIEEITTLNFLKSIEDQCKIRFINLSFFQYLIKNNTYKKYFKIPNSKKVNEKIKDIFKKIINQNIDGIYISNVYTASWILNKRSNITPSCHIELKLLIFKDGSFKIIKNINDFLEFKNLNIAIDQNEITIFDYNNLANFITNLTHINYKENVYLLQAIKEKNEIKNIKIAHKKHAKAFKKLQSYVLKNKTKLSETDISNKLLEFCKQDKSFVCNSFETIVGVDENSSLIHYRAGTFNKYIQDNSIILIDCGGQYKFGTTDVTRMIILGNTSKEFQFHYNLVLKAHIKLAMTIFDKNTLAKELDFIARNEILKYNLDYNHGTGHGVGYFLNVHEYPSIGKNSNYNLSENIIVSIEPGLYFEGKYGIRIENLYLIKKYKNKLKFQNLTKIPIEKSIIDEKFFTEDELKFIKKL